MLQVRDLHAYYDRSHIVQGVDLEIGKGQIVSLLGRNGVGRSTMIKAIMGLVQREGSIKFKGRDIGRAKSFEIAKAGLGYVPESRDIFPTLTVRQNLLLGEKRGQTKTRWPVDEMLSLFSNLRERADTAAGVLSGGEKQMLTMCRTLVGDPDLIMIDEPTEGLAPRVVDQVSELLQEMLRRGVSVLLVEQKLTIALKVSGRVLVMGHGRIVFEGTPDDLDNNPAIRSEWLEVS
jgi:branched-chain amino acid transport system ATP-binding protein